MIIDNEPLSRRDFGKLVAASLLLPQAHLSALSPQFETVGTDNALTEAQYNQLKADRNNQPFTRDNQTYRGTMVVWESVHNTFPQLNANLLGGEDLVSFVARHAARHNQLLKANPYSTNVGLELARYVVVKDYVTPTVSTDTTYGTNGFKDSGVFLLKQQDGKNYDLNVPGIGFNFDLATKEDRGLTHDMGHFFRFVRDYYQQDFPFPTADTPAPPVLASFDPSFQGYSHSFRPDVGNDLMSTTASKIGDYDALLMRDRYQRGITADWTENSKDLNNGWQPYFLPSYRLAFRNDQDLLPMRVEVYASEYRGGKKVLTESPRLVLTPNGRHRWVDIDPKQAFITLPTGYAPQVVIPFGREDLFLKVYAQRINDTSVRPYGEEFGRWMDVADFGKALWLNQPDMTMNVFSAKDKASDFKWDIEPSVSTKAIPADGFRVQLPLAAR